MIYSIHQIRAIAALLVVLTHTAALMGNKSQSLAPMNLQEVNISFTFAAGFLFRHLHLETPFKNFIAQRFKNVLLPYALTSIPAILIYSFGAKSHPHVKLDAFPEWMVPAYLLLTGLHLGPLWFIPMIFVTYLCTPTIKKADATALTLISAFLISFLVSILWISRPLYNANPLQAAAHYLPVFFLGMLCSRCNCEISAACQKAPVWGAAAAALVFLACWTKDLPLEYQFGIKVLMLICLFAVTCRSAKFQNKAIDLIARYSFGIFFIHGYFIAALRMAQDRGSFELPKTAVTLYLTSAAICAACIGIIHLTKKTIGSRSRVLIGA